MFRYGLVNFWDGTVTQPGPSLLYARLLDAPYLICNRPVDSSDPICLAFQVLAGEQLDYTIRTVSRRPFHFRFPYGLAVVPDVPP